jgi:type I restriction enzyme M protein
MSAQEQQQQLGKTLWGMADQLRGAMNADDFRDYMLSFLFLRYLSDNYEALKNHQEGLMRQSLPNLAEE